MPVRLLTLDDRIDELRHSEFVHRHNRHHRVIGVNFDSVPSDNLSKHLFRVDGASHIQSPSKCDLV